MLRCREITTLVANGELDEAGPWLKMKIRMHLALCRHCGRYARQIQVIGAGARQRFQGSPPPEEKLEQLQRRILDAAGGGSDEERS